MKGAALHKLDELKLGVPWIARIRLGLHGVMIGRGVLFLFIFIPLSLLGCLLLYLIERSRQTPNNTNEMAGGFGSQEAANGGQTSGQGFHAWENKTLNPRMAEYIRTLTQLGLGNDAGVKDIKTAYRAAVKKLHPDATQEVTNPVASQQFIDLTMAYERALDLRRELKMDEE